MTATTHTEIYRPLKGELKPARVRAVPLWRARVHVALKSKLAMLLLFVPPWLGGVVFSFVVYSKFTLEQGLESPVTGSAASSLVSTLAGQLIQVQDQIVNSTILTQLFAMVAIAWYGGGLICEDRRAGAHLLYFSRPLTRFDYFLAHFLTALTFGAIVTLGPMLLVCIVAVFSSPDYSFLTEKWDVLLGAVGYGVIHITVVSMIVLALSSLSSRKTYALASIVVFMLSTHAFAGALVGAQRDSDLWMLSINANSQRLANWMIGAQHSSLHWDARYSLAILGGVTLLAGLVTWRRLRRLEVVA